nr:PREDICTED: visual system homeobox 1 [Bos mutus]
MRAGSGEQCSMGDIQEKLHRAGLFIEMAAREEEAMPDMEETVDEYEAEAASEEHKEAIKEEPGGEAEDGEPRATAQPSGSPAKWEATVSSPGSSSLGRVLPCRHSPRAAWGPTQPSTGQPEILAATAIQDTPWSSPGSPAGEEGVEATLETPLSEDEYQALLDMLPGSPGPIATGSRRRRLVLKPSQKDALQMLPALLRHRGPIATGSPRRRLILTLSQKDALQALFQQNPSPGIATRERLARELGIDESRVQVWFQNQRRQSKQSRPPSEHGTLGSGCLGSLGRGPCFRALSGKAKEERDTGTCMCGECWCVCMHTHASTIDPGMQSIWYLCCEHSTGLNVLSSRRVLLLVEDSAREARRKRTVISPSQTRILMQAFTRDRFPGIATREELAHQTGIPEPHLQSTLMTLAGGSPPPECDAQNTSVRKNPRAWTQVRPPVTSMTQSRSHLWTDPSAK